MMICVLSCLYGRTSGAIVPGNADGGIAARGFQRSFRLADHIKVVSAEMNDGLLTIHLLREVPEEAKPRMIPINGKAPAIEGKKAN